MNAIKLVKQGTDEVVAYACGKCGVVAAHEILAERCCDKRCQDCGKPAPVNNIYCDDCWAKCREEKRLEQFNKATKIPASEYEGPVYVEEGDKYYPSMSDLEDDYEPATEPKYVYAVTEHTFSLPSGEDVVEQAVESGEWSEETEATDVEGLQEFVAQWNAKQTSITWWPDFTRAIVTQEPPNE